MAKRSSVRSSAVARPAQQGILHNRLLASLPHIDRTRILPTLVIARLKLRDILHKPGVPIRFVYFPGGGFLSIVKYLSNRRIVEVATIGREGMAWPAAVLEGIPVSSGTMVQAESALCYRMSADAFRREMRRRGAFCERINAYWHAMIGIVMQATACNAVHAVERRFARWCSCRTTGWAQRNFPSRRSLPP
jgi:hypothetical protein